MVHYLNGLVTGLQRTQKVVLNDEASNEVKVTLGVLKAQSWGH